MRCGTRAKEKRYGVLICTVLLFSVALICGRTDRVHLAGIESATAPTRPKPRVSIETELGTIELQLEAQRAPMTVSNFLRYVKAGFYNDGVFHRTVTSANQTNAVKIQVIQASANPAKTNQFFPPIVLERTRDTGLKHVGGSISMARDGPNTAQDEFFICIGDQPELDFGGKRNPDGQGFAAFGKVVRGMEVVRKIHESPADEQKLTPAIRIQRAVRIE
jgi:peptidyl-prolyl cis-trans isomerase A (cyclophilin A)